MKIYLILFLLLFCGQVFGQKVVGRGTANQIAGGNEKGWTSDFKFGHNPDVDTGSDPETMWETGGVYLVFPDDSTMDIVSSSTDDDAGGTGAITVRIFGVDSSFARNQEDVTLNGTTEVTLANKYRVIYRVVVLTAGSGDTNAGALTIATTTATGARTLCTVGADDGQSHIAVFPVAAGEEAFVYSWGFSQLTAAVDATLHLMVYRVNAGNDGVWNVRDTSHSRVTGTTAVQRDFMPTPLMIAGPAIIKIEIFFTDTDNGNFTGHFMVLYR